MWELPSYILSESNDSTAKSRKKDAREFVTSLFGYNTSGPVQKQHSQFKYMGELGSIPWVFSHLKLHMHVHLFQLEDKQNISLVAGPCQRRWAAPEDVEAETMGTGMRQCWSLVAESAS